MLIQTEKTRHIIRLDMSNLTQTDCVKFMECYTKLFPRVTVTDINGSNNKPLSLIELLGNTKTEKLEPINSERVRELIKVYAPIIFDDYDVTTDDSLLKLNGVVIMNMGAIIDDSKESWVKYLSLISDAYLTESNYDFIKRIIVGWKYDPIPFKLKVKPKSLVRRLVEKLLNH